MFDYLASGKIIVSSKRDGICEILKHNYNSIIVNKYDLDCWIYEIDKIMSKKYDLIKFRKNSLKTAKKYTWDKRVDRILITGISGQDGVFLTSKLFSINNNIKIYGISRNINNPNFGR